MHKSDGPLRLDLVFAGACRTNGPRGLRSSEIRQGQVTYNRFLNRNTFQESFWATAVTLPPSNLAAELTDGTIAFGFSYELAASMSSL